MAEPVNWMNAKACAEWLCDAGSGDVACLTPKETRNLARAYLALAARTEPPTEKE